MYYAEVVYKGALAGTICSNLCFAFAGKKNRDEWVSLQNCKANANYADEHNPFRGLTSAEARRKYPYKNCFGERSVRTHRTITGLDDKW